MLLAEPKAAYVLPLKAGHTLPSVRRIKRRVEFENALHSDCLTNKWFAVYLRKNDYGFARLGLIVGKRTMPKAVARNFAKRMIREMFRCNFALDYSLDVVVRARRQFKPETSAEGRLALTLLFQSVQK